MFGHVGQNHRGSSRGVHVVSGSTFDGKPYQIALEDATFEFGSSANLRKGKMLTGEPLVVAVKVFKERLNRVKKELLVRELRFSREIALRHPQLLAFIGTATVDGQTAIVTLYMRNGNLMEYIKAHPGCDKKKLILEVAEAVEFLHGTARLVHGDIKCANFLISDFGKALVADFGLSTFAEKSQSAAETMTAIRQMNTLQFAAPELLMGEGNTTLSKTCASDVYAFGMLVLEALSEELPWSNQGSFSVVQKICSGEHPVRPTRDGGLLVSVSHSWWTTCLRCWNFTPSERPSINAVMTTLRYTEPAPCRKLSCEDIVTSCVYTPDGKTIVAGCLNGSIALFDTVMGLTRYLSHPFVIPETRYPPAVAVSPAGQRIAYTFGEMILLWDFASSAVLATTQPGTHVTCVAYSLDGTLVASGGEDSTVQLWNATTGVAVGQRLQGHSAVVNCVSFLPQGTSLASGSDDGAIILWDSVTGASMGTLVSQDGPATVEAISFSPDGTYLVSAGNCSMVVVWDLREMRPVHIFEANADTVWSVAFSPSGQYVAAGSEDGDILIWDVRDGNQIGVLSTGEERPVASLAFSPDGRSLVSAIWDKEVDLWDLFE